MSRVPFSSPVADHKPQITGSGFIQTGGTGTQSEGGGNPTTSVNTTPADEDRLDLSEECTAKGARHWLFRNQSKGLRGFRLCQRSL